MNPNKALWEKGDFTRLAETMRESGAAQVAKLGITKGLNVLDLGCSDGTTAIPEAKLGATVLGVDIARNLIAEFLNNFKNYYGPTMNAFVAAEKNGKASELQQELEVLFNRQNESADGNTTSIPATFLRVTVIR